MIDLDISKLIFPLLDGKVSSFPHLFPHPSSVMAIPKLSASFWRYPPIFAGLQDKPYSFC
jgi:hypothetical protein